MNPDQEHELKEAISSLCTRYQIKGHALLYLEENNKVHFVGDMSFDVIAPWLVKYLASKVK